MSSTVSCMHGNRTEISRTNTKRSWGFHTLPSTAPGWMSMASTSDMRACSASAITCAAQSQARVEIDNTRHADRFDQCTQRIL